jgi:histidine triad (HIT) family protein
MEDFFCKVYREKIGLIYENEYFYSRFDRYPISPGHAEVIPKRHVVSLFDLTAREWSFLKGALEDTTSLIKSYPLKDMYAEFSKEFKDVHKNSPWYDEMLKNPGDKVTREYATKMLTHVGIEKITDDYNFGNNDGINAGRTVDHLHIHIIPRFPGDAIDSRFGIRWIIPELANYKK